jgi:hypothetical protein
MKFPVASNYSCNHKKNRFRVKTSPPQNCELKQEPCTLEYLLFSEKGFLLLAIMKDTKGSDFIYRYS